ncbi:MAG: ACP S-malonyltransferase [Puniceicoccales bacterium]|nr:ACP S-malonyltransferase [Puniceicoccales bacterium]
MSTALVFPGQGAQYVGMGQSLCDGSCSAREIFAAAEKLLGASFLHACFDGPFEILAQTKICQPALFVHGCAATVVLREKFTKKKYSVAYGLSLGELTALWAADVFDFDVALRVVAERGRLMQKACEETDGAMLCLIGGTREDVETLCAETNVELANINCPGQIVISGMRNSIKAANEIAEKMRFRRVLQLNVAGAYHSRLMESACVGFEKFLKTIDLRPPKVATLTNVTGEPVSDPAKIKKTLAEQIISPVFFEKCCRSAIGIGADEFLECGPGKSLCGMMKKISETVNVKNFDKMDDFDYGNSP